MATRIYIEEGRFYEEQTERRDLGSEAQLLAKLALKQDLRNMGPIFNMENPFVYISGQPDMLPVTILEGQKERIFKIPFNDIPWLGWWSISQEIIEDIQTILWSPVLYRSKDKISATVLRKDVSFYIPPEWGSFVMYVECTKVEGYGLGLKEIYIIFEVNTDTKPSFPHKYIRCGLPNNYPEGRFCLGDIPYRQKSSISAYNLDQDMIKYLWSYVWKSGFNRDLSYRIDWMTLDMEQEPIQPKDNIKLQNLGSKQEQSTEDPETQARFGFLHSLSNMTSGIIKQDRMVLRYATTN